MSNKTSPAAVSARLRRAGFGIVATYNREGIRVRHDGGRGSGKVCVVVDLDRTGEATRLADTLAEELQGWDGYNVRRSGDVHFYITKAEAPAPETSAIEAPTALDVTTPAGCPETTDGTHYVEWVSRPAMHHNGQQVSGDERRGICAWCAEIFVEAN